MLILTCGPSGSGKTTIIKHMLNNPLFSVIPVDVVSADRVYECGLGRNQVTIEVFRQNELDNVYTHVYQYNEQTGKYDKATIKHVDIETSPEEVIGLPDNACVLIPLYIASQLYKDDDIAQATAYRNEFEVGLQDLTYNIENQDTIREVY